MKMMKKKRMMMMLMLRVIPQYSLKGQAKNEECKQQ